MKNILVIALIICVLLSLIFLFKSFFTPPKFVEIKTPFDKTGALYPLHENRELSLEGRIGKVIIEIKDRRVRVRESSCPDKVCVKTGWIKRSGEIIVCAPNQITIRILGFKDSLLP